MNLDVEMLLNEAATNRRRTCRDVTAHRYGSGFTPWAMKLRRLLLALLPVAVALVVVASYLAMPEANHPDANWKVSHTQLYNSIDNVFRQQ